METVALESDGKQMEWSGNGTKQAEIMQKIFPHFFVYCPAKSEVAFLCFTFAVPDFPHP